VRFAPFPPARVRKRFNALIFSGLDKPARRQSTRRAAGYCCCFRVAVNGASLAAAAGGQLLPQAVGLDQLNLRISKLLRPIVAQPAKVGLVPLFALREPLDRLGPPGGLFQLLPLAQHLFEALSVKTMS
jgi:hypothetical protein